MNEEQFKHLTNLLRHSTAVTFHIPSLFFKDTKGLEKQKQEVENAWINLQRDMDLLIYKQEDLTDKDLITIQIQVKQPEENR